MDGDGYAEHGLVVVGLVALTLTSAAAVYRAAGDFGSVLFGAVSYAALLRLLWCLRAYERAPLGAAERERLRRAVWCLCTLLTVLFAWKVAALLPWPAALLVWALALVTTVGGFVALFRRP